MRRQFQQNLPKLNTTSQLRFRTTSKGHSYTQDGKNNDDSKLHTLRQQNSTSYGSKALKYQTSGVIFSKKKEQQQNKLKYLEEQIKTIQKTLNSTRNQKSQQSKTRTRTMQIKYYHDQQEDKVQQQDDKKHKKPKPRRLVNLNDIKQMKAQIDNFKKTIKDYQKKEDQIKKDNAYLQTQVNKYRKQINTIKNQIENIENDIQEQAPMYYQCLQDNKVINQQAASKYLELHHKKADKAHQQTKKLKKYDEILKSITRQIQDEKLKATSKPTFYITQINFSQLKSPTKSPTKRSGSPSKRRFNLPLTELQSLLRQYEQQFSKIQQQAGTTNFNQIGEQFVQHQKQKFSILKFTNGLSQELQQKQQQQQQLKKRLSAAKQQQLFKYSHTRQSELDQITENLALTRKNNTKYRQNAESFQKIITDLKVSIPLLIQRLGIRFQDQPQLLKYNLKSLDQNDLIPLLIIIQQRKNELTQNREFSPNKTVKINQFQVQQQIENAKKQFSQLQRTQNMRNKQSQTKYQKFLDKNELIKTFDFNKSKKEKRKN